MYNKVNASPMRFIPTLVLGLFVLTVSACGGGSGDSQDSGGEISGLEIVSAVFREGITGCHLVVTAKNTTSQRKSAILYYEAFNKAGQAIGYTVTQQFRIAPNSTQTTSSQYEHVFLSNDGRLIKSCTSISSIKFVKKQSIVT